MAFRYGNLALRLQGRGNVVSSFVALHRQALEVNLKPIMRHLGLQAGSPNKEVKKYQ